MAEQVKLDIPRVEVRYSDGRTTIVTAENPDLVFYDLERAKRRWPQGQDAPMLWINYLAFSKLHRTGEIDRAMTFEDWLSSTQLVRNVDNDDEPSDELASVGPTQEAAALV